MEFRLFYYVCDSCETNFTSPTTKSRYGEFLMRSDYGELRYLNALEDLVFDEFSTLLKKFRQKENIKEDVYEEINVMHDSFGFACDPSDKNTFFQINTKPLCPKCGQSKFKSWGPTNPPQFIEIEVKQVTHKLWNSLDKTDKEKIAALAVRNKYEGIKTLLLSLKN